MSFAVLVLLLGLALLVLAAGLFWRASKGPSQTHTPAPGLEQELDPAPASTADPVPDKLTEEQPDEPQDAAPTVRQEQEREPEVAPEPEAIPEPAPEQAAEPIPEPTQDPEEATEAAPAADAAASSNGLFAGRRSRRQWAQSHGYEYAKEDRYLPGEWPDSLMTLISADAATGSAATVARDLVSGFTGGHQFHLAEVNGMTVVALRREFFSPVRVHLSDTAGMPAGMRHSELCDRPPYTGYSTDNRALDRMLDSRVEAALHALAGSVSDIAFSSTWVALKMGRRTDPPIWDHVLVQGRALVDASRVLPPRVTSVELDLSGADPTRPRVRAAATAVAEEPEAQDAAGAASDASDASGTSGERQAPAHRGHLRAVPDAARRASSPNSEVDADAETANDSDADTGRPRMERSTTPVDFPTRSEGQTMGDTSTFPEYPADRADQDRPAQDGAAQDDDPIPAVGEDPDHSRTVSGGGPRVIRTAEQRSTIFGDDTSAEVDILGAAGAASRGRHRAPSARHARHIGESGEYPEVDAEVVDPEDT
ncbi:hypothetical protein ACT3SZ_10065 [Corynebacterium sp. AOP40-9SA-29]|uniref:hypothetical protein n=1 Tax=Corynebacterium sp. AOP40-9SA-29 TaxID=3457677 RepID=UPI0040339997